jgi:hypothetical protein
MKRIVVVLIALVSFASYNSPINGDNDKSNNSELVEKLVPIVKSILEGDDYSKFKANISPEAYVINANTYESIFEILDNPTKKEKFIEGKGIKVEFVHLWLSDNQSEAYMVLETKSSDNRKTSWDSIYFNTNKEHKWQILSWHKS